MALHSGSGNREAEDAALEAQAPEGSSPEGELTGKPCSSNSDALTNS